MTAVLEVTLSWLFKNAKGRDAKAFHTNPALSKLEQQEQQEQTLITLTSPDCGPTDAQLSVDYTADGAGRFPALEWSAPADVAAQVREWLLVCEDPDAPLPTPVCHGLFGGIPPTKTSVVDDDFKIADKTKVLLNGGFHYGKTLRGVPYVPPRPLLNHGPHRYFYHIVALKKPLDPSFLSAKPTREQIAKAIEGNVLGRGMWVGICERKWK